MHRIVCIALGSMVGKVRYGAASQAMVKLTLVAAREESKKNLTFSIWHYGRRRNYSDGKTGSRQV